MLWTELGPAVATNTIPRNAPAAAVIASKGPRTVCPARYRTSIAGQGRRWPPLFRESVVRNYRAGDEVVRTQIGGRSLRPLKEAQIRGLSAQFDSDLMISVI